MKNLLRKRWFKLLLVVLAIGAGVGAWYLARPVYHIRISRETTYLTGPLRPDGTVDYLAAIEANQREGVTPENNAAVLLLEALGSRLLDGTEPNFAAHRMGVALPDARAPWRLADWHFYASVNDPQTKQTTCRPWKTDEFPHIAKYLASGERAIALVIAASKRPRLYIPLASLGAEQRLALYITRTSFPHDIGIRPLAARAMLRLSRGDIDDVWSDLVACHRLTRLMAGQCWRGSWLDAWDQERIVLTADAALLAHAQLDGATARKLLADFRALPAFPDLTRALLTERFMRLDATAMRDGDKILLLGGLSDYGHTPKPTTSANWGEAMVLFNGFYDRIEQATRLPPPQARDILQGIERDIDAMDQRAGPFRRGWFAQLLAKVGMGDDRPQVSTETVVVALRPWLICQDVLRSEALRVRTAIAELGFAMAAFRAERGHYPAKLDELMPDYMSSIPMDSFSGRPLVYELKPEGYQLYSIGPDMRDDHGKQWEGDGGNDGGDVVLSVSE